jgi:hypothetical protein
MEYIIDRFAGSSTVDAAKRRGIDVTTAHRFDRGEPGSSGYPLWVEHCEGKQPFAAAVLRHTHNALPRTAEALSAAEHAAAQSRGHRRTMSPAAQAALRDFPTFRRRYFAHWTTPWQAQAAGIIDERLAQCAETGEKAYILMNVAPGLGKTTMLHEFCARATCRDRALTGMIGSKVSKLAESSVGRLRRDFERTYPVEGALATLAGDFGMFKPDNRADKWQEASFVVVQDDGQLIEEKEPTWQAFGMDSKAFRGFRVRLAWWDDIVDEDIKYSPTMLAKQEEIWDNKCETRINPGGVLAVTGQIIDTRDLYNYIAEKEAAVEDELELLLDPDGPRPHKYTRIVFKAHDEERCTNQHGTRKNPPPAWPEGCLLDPVSLPWVECKEIRKNKADTWAVQYQCEDVEGIRHVVEKGWVEHCWDDRGLWQLPDGIKATDNVITCDPSSTNWWATQAWAYYHEGDKNAYGGRRFLLDLANRRMETPDLLGFNNDSQEFHGLLEEWRQRYARMGRRLHVVLFEHNAAQRYFLQNEHVKRWARIYQVRVLPHQTGAHKLDKDLGVWMLSAQWEFGRVRLPGATPDIRQHVRPLITQVTSAPYGKVEDQLMAEWFLEANLHRVHQPALPPDGHRERRPVWLKQTVREMMTAR